MTSSLQSTSQFILSASQRITLLIPFLQRATKLALQALYMLHICYSISICPPVTLWYCVKAKERDVVN